MSNSRLEGSRDQYFGIGSQATDVTLVEYMLNPEDVEDVYYLKGV
jgi:hypothetical protein